MGMPMYYVHAIGNYFFTSFKQANEVGSVHYMVVRHPLERLLSGWEDKFNRVCLENCHTTRVFY